MTFVCFILFYYLFFTSFLLKVHISINNYLIIWLKIIIIISFAFIINELLIIAFASSDHYYLIEYTLVLENFYILVGYTQFSKS